jgi:hypothetical protein
MSGNFRQAYAALTDFIAQHPEIGIGDSVISIPEGVRAEFYRFFNEARDAFTEERFPMHLARAALLTDKYRAAKEKVKGLVELEDTPTVPGLQRFLADPKSCLARELFDPLFDLLKGRESVDGFEKTASEKIEAGFLNFFRGGYEKWAVLSLVSLWEADKAFRVDVRNLNPGERVRSAAYAPLEEVPAPAESNRFLFSQPRNAIFAVPDLIVRSRRLNRFIGVRSEFRGGVYNAWDHSREREWHPVDTDLQMLLESGLTLLYAAPRAEDIALVADVAKFCRPDLVAWCVDTGRMHPAAVLEKMTRLHRRLKPPKGSYLIASDPWPEPPAPVEPGGGAQGIHLLTAGLAESCLTPVALALAESGGVDGPS